MSSIIRKANKIYKNTLSIIFIIILIYYVFCLITHNNPILFKSIYPSTSVSSTPTFTPNPNETYPTYPNPNLTPGDVIATATKEQICTSGYSSTVRSVTTETKKQVYQEYGLTYPQPSGDYEVDHFISLELGGSNDIKNLWPEPAEPKPGFHEKDVVENYLHSQLCNENETLQQVQEEMRSDWLAVYNRIPK